MQCAWDNTAMLGAMLASALDPSHKVYLPGHSRASSRTKGCCWLPGSCSHGLLIMLSRNLASLTLASRQQQPPAVVSESPAAVIGRRRAHLTLSPATRPDQSPLQKQNFDYDIH